MHKQLLEVMELIQVVQVAEVAGLVRFMELEVLGVRMGILLVAEEGGLAPMLLAVVVLPDKVVRGLVVVVVQAMALEVAEQARMGVLIRGLTQLEGRG